MKKELLTPTVLLSLGGIGTGLIAFTETGLQRDLEVYIDTYYFLYNFLGQDQLSQKIVNTLLGQGSDLGMMLIAPTFCYLVGNFFNILNRLHSPNSGKSSEELERSIIQISLLAAIGYIAIELATFFKDAPVNQKSEEFGSGDMRDLAVFAIPLISYAFFLLLKMKNEAAS